MSLHGHITVTHSPSFTLQFTNLGLNGGSFLVMPSCSFGVILDILVSSACWQSRMKLQEQLCADFCWDTCFHLLGVNTEGQMCWWYGKSVSVKKRLWQGWLSPPFYGTGTLKKLWKHIFEHWETDNIDLELLIEGKRMSELYNYSFPPGGTRTVENKSTSWC